VRIELSDGSRISGELLDLGDGVAVVRSESLGRVEVRIDQIEVMQRTGSQARPSSTTPSDAQREVQKTQLNALQGALASDVDAMAAIASLRGHPLILEILGDKDLMQKIRRGDYEALTLDSRLEALSHHPAVKELSQSVSAEQ